MKRTLFSFICLTMGLFSIVSYAKNDEDNGKKEEKTEKADSVGTKKVKDRYAKTFIKDKSCVTAKTDGGFMTIHKVNNKIYVELPKEFLNREMLIASTITAASDPNLGAIGYKPQSPIHVRFSLADSTVLMNEVTVLPEFDKSNPEMFRAIKRSCMDPVIKAFEIFCENPDKTAFVFDMTSILSGNYDALAPVKSGGSGGINMKVSYNSSASSIGGIKAFKDNVSIKNILSYKVDANLMGLVLLKKDAPFTVEETRSILLLPEKKMKPRVSDSRVGIFNTMNLDYTSDSDRIETYSMIHRWNLVPKDMEAWKRGELVEPEKQIVLYLDSAFPEKWREPARKGIYRWNEAFEKIGFKNVILIKDFPTDDPEFDPDNLKYSCIRYIPAQIANAMGPSWVDPSTGEIINASILVYNDILQVINDWRFAQTAQLDESVRSRKISDEIMTESLEYVIAHEFGHVLGFMHNMSASAAFPTDSLRSVSFTQKYGTTPSIMDYARFNYVAQPEDKGVNLTPPFLGVYDYFLVKYAYCPIPEAESLKEEMPVLEKWVDEKAGDPLFRYGRQQLVHRYDPSAIEEDLGDDPIKSSDYGIKNLKYILSHFNEWMPDSTDRDASLRENRYEVVANQFNRYIRAVMLNIGGIYLTSVKAGTDGESAIPVSKEYQHQSVLWCINQLKNCAWINDRNITDKFSLRVELEPIFQYYTALELFSTYKNVLLSSHLARTPEEAYTLQNWLDDMYENLWLKTENKKELTSGERILQKLYISTLTGVIGKSSQFVKLKSLTSDPYMPSVRHMAAFGMGSRLIQEYLPVLSEYEVQNGVGSVMATIEDNNFGKPGYGWQYRVNTRTLDNSNELFYGEAVRLVKLIEKRINSSGGETKSHYIAMLQQLRAKLVR